MQVIQIDLKREPDIADLVKTMEPGDRIDLHASIKGLDQQTLTLTVESAEEGKEETEADPDKPDDTKAGGDMDGGPTPSRMDPAALMGGEQAVT